MEKKKQQKSQCSNCHAYRHTVQDCGFTFCLFCLKKNYQNNHHHCNRDVVKNFGNFATIGSYQKYARSLLVGENYEAVRIRLQNERNLLTVTNDNQPAPQQLSAMPYSPSNDYEPAPQSELPLPPQEQSQPMSPVPQQQRGNYEQSPAAQIIPQRIEDAAQASQHGPDQVVQEPQGTRPTTPIPYWKRDCYCTSFCSICSPSTFE
uniref:Uncharacterized protein n=1 Tax=Panagrolaimus sp. ES5 TaxID=591445 RepID=A0AC34G9Q2_9BILA